MNAYGTKKLRNGLVRVFAVPVFVMLYHFHDRLYLGRLGHRHYVVSFLIIFVISPSSLKRVSRIPHCACTKLVSKRITSISFPRCYLVIRLQQKCIRTLLARRGASSIYRSRAVNPSIICAILLSAPRLRYSVLTPTVGSASCSSGSVRG